MSTDADFSPITDFKIVIADREQSQCYNKHQAHEPGLPKYRESESESEKLMIWTVCTD